MLLFLCICLKWSHYKASFHVLSWLFWHVWHEVKATVNINANNFLNNGLNFNPFALLELSQSSLCNECFSFIYYWTCLILHRKISKDTKCIYVKHVGQVWHPCGQTHRQTELSKSMLSLLGYFQSHYLPLSFGLRAVLFPEFSLK